MHLLYDQIDANYSFQFCSQQEWISLPDSYQPRLLLDSYYQPAMDHMKCMSSLGTCVSESNLPVEGFCTWPEKSCCNHRDLIREGKEKPRDSPCRPRNTHCCSTAAQYSTLKTNTITLTVRSNCCFTPLPPTHTFFKILMKDIFVKFEVRTCKLYLVHFPCRSYSFPVIFSAYISNRMSEIKHTQIFHLSSQVSGEESCFESPLH